ncbi:MAG TPA: hypothetical protein VGF43_18845 [Dongiaceae bacterium]
MRDLGGMTLDQSRGYIAGIRNPGAHLLSLSNDILDCSRSRPASAGDPPMARRAAPAAERGGPAGNAIKSAPGRDRAFRRR